MNHPAGRIGKRLILNVKDVMKPVTGLPLCGPEDKLVNVLVELSSKGCGCVLVVDGDLKLVGTFTDGDLRRKLSEHGGSVLQKTMAELMSNTPRVTTEDTKAVEAMRNMESPTQVSFLPVVENAKSMKLAGLVTLHGLVNAGL